MLGATSFEEIAALGCAGPPVSFPRKTRSDYFSSGRLGLSIWARWCLHMPNGATT